MWFPDLVQLLKERDDEMTQKKRPMCTMQPENREYFVQAMPVNRMNCVGKSSINAQSNGAANLEILPFLQHIMITLFFAYF